MKRQTMREVAARAGVSIGTVSNVLNHPELVAESTLERVRQAIEDVGFVRNAAARQLRAAQRAALGLVVLDIDNPFFTQVAKGVEAAASEADQLVILCNSSGDRSREERHLHLLEEQRVTGVLITPTGRTPSPLLQELRERGTPVVLLDRHSGRRDQCSVAVDDKKGGRLAAEHLVGLGHKRIALVNGPLDIKQCADRRSGFLSALEESGLHLTRAYDIEVDVMSMAAGQEAAKRLVAEKNPPTAIFCANDLMAVGVEHAVLAANLAIPEQVAVVGYDDVPFASMAFVPLTSIRQPAFDQGYRAATLLIDEAAGVGHQHERILFTPELVIRRSTVASA